MYIHAHVGVVVCTHPVSSFLVERKEHAPAVALCPAHGGARGVEPSVFCLRVLFNVVQPPSNRMSRDTKEFDFEPWDGTPGDAWEKAEEMERLDKATQWKNLHRRRTQRRMPLATPRMPLRLINSLCKIWLHQ